MGQNDVLKGQINTLQAELSQLQENIQELKISKYDLIGQRESIKREIKNLNIILQDDNEKLQSVREQIKHDEKEAILTLDTIDQLKNEI